MAEREKASERGFTLIELLVVVIIIGILASIAIPVFMNQKAKAADAALRSDMKSSVATVVAAPEDGESWAAFSARVGLNRNSAVVENRSGKASAVADRLWNSLNGTPKISVSDGSFLEIVIITKDDSIWSSKHAAGEFCIKAANIKSSYNRPWSTIEDANKSLYYDSREGKILTIEQLDSLGEDPASLSCYGFVKSYRAAK